MSYIGLFSYYNFDNWTYQPSYVSSNTPWFFNGMRVRSGFPNQKLKIEPWLVNGWQSYGKFNGRPGVGGQILWRPTAWFSFVGNQYGVGRRHDRAASHAHAHRRQHSGEVSRQYGEAARQVGVLAHHRRGLRIGRRSDVHRAAKAVLRRTSSGSCSITGGGSIATCSRRPSAVESDVESGTLPGAAAPDRRRDGGDGNALLHRESGAIVPGVGRAGDLRLHARASG